MWFQKCQFSPKIDFFVKFQFRLENLENYRNSMKNGEKRDKHRKSKKNIPNETLENLEKKHGNFFKIFVNILMPSKSS